MARIAVLAQYYYPAFNAGGPVPGIRNAIQSFNGHSVHVFTSDRDLGGAEPYGEPFVGQATVDHAQVTYLPKLSTRTATAWSTAIKQVLQSDAVYVNSIFSTFFTIAPLTIMLLGRYRGKVALAPRGELAPSALALGRSRHKAFLLSLFRLLAMDRSVGAKKNVVWLASSLKEERDILEVFPDAQVCVSPETLRTSSSGVPAANRVPGTELELVCVARLAPVKGILDLFRGLTRVTVPVHLRLVGPAEDPDYVSRLRAVEARFPDGVHVSWLGGLSAEAVIDVFRTAHFSVLLSRGENFSHAIGESLLAGCPVLISDQTPWSFVAERKAGFVLRLAECQDPDQVAHQIDEIAAMTETSWRGMRLAARRCGEAGLVLPGSVTVAEALGYGSAR